MEQHCINCVYKTIPGITKTYPTNEILFLEGDLLEKVYRIEEGYIKMNKFLDSGDEIIIGILGPGDFVALIAVLQGKNEYIASALSLTTTTVKAIEIGAIKKAFHSNTMFKDNCLNCAITRTNFFQFQITQNANNDTEEKILNVLESFYKKFGDHLQQQKTLTLPFSKTVLSNIIGIRRETLSRHLKILQDQKVLQVIKNKYIFL